MNDRIFKQLEIGMEEALTEKPYRRQISALTDHAFRHIVRQCTACASTNVGEIGGEMLCMDCGQDAWVLGNTVVAENA